MSGIQNQQPPLPPDTVAFLMISDRLMSYLTRRPENKNADAEGRDKTEAQPNEGKGHERQ